MITISIVLTTYNSGNRIREVLNSIFNQEGLDKIFRIDLVVVDDCSTDSTTKIIQDFDVDFISTQKNTGGPNFGRNVGLQRCTGDFIIIADHDDVWFSDRLIKLVSASHLAPIITSGYVVKDLVNEREIIRANKSKSSQDHIIYKKNETFLAKLKKDRAGQITYLGSIMFSSKLSNINFEEKEGMIDYDWVLKLFHNQKSVELCIPLYNRRVDKDNLSLNINYRIIDYNHSIDITSQYIQEYPKEVMLSVKRINGSLARYYYLTGKMKLARKYFFKSEASFKHFLYVITTFVGSKLVKRYFNVFG